MFNVELFESVVAVVGVVVLPLVLFLAVVFVMAIPIGIVVKTAEAIRCGVRGMRTTRSAGAHATGAWGQPRRRTTS